LRDGIDKVGLASLVRCGCVSVFLPLSLSQDSISSTSLCTNLLHSGCLLPNYSNTTSHPPSFDCLTHTSTTHTQQALLIRPQPNKTTLQNSSLSTSQPPILTTNSNYNVPQTNRLQAPLRLPILPRRQRRPTSREQISLPTTKSRSHAPQIHRCCPRRHFRRCCW
jgi:hypothetical protein